VVLLVQFGSLFYILPAFL